MAVYRTKKGVWFVQYREPGRKSPVKEYFGVGPSGEQDARERDAEIGYLRALGKEVRTPEKIRLDVLAQEYLRDAKARGRGEKWLKEWSNILNKRILPTLCRKPIEDLAWSDVLTMLEAGWPTAKPTTKNRYLGYLKAVFQYGVKKRLISRHPLEDWVKPTERKKSFALTVADLKKIISCAEPHVAWAMEVAYETGARPGETELLALRWGDVRWSECAVHIPGSKTATSDRVVPVSPEFLGRLRERAGGATEHIVQYGGHPIRKLRRGPQTAAKRAEITYPFVMYDIRHLYATEMLRNGADLAAVSMLLGHSDIETTQRRYYHLLAGEQRRAVGMLPDLRKSVTRGKVVSLKVGTKVGTNGEK
ncbi:MAG: hypothetical protein PWQ57_3121 [Desulfovibrionales bacterium]|nr:hypothetical protein [Desulfovibrionales bacterium]